MTKEQIEKEMAEMVEWMPISKIEETLQMPPTTLQKVLKGVRILPKKWDRKLEMFFTLNQPTVPEKNNHQTPLTENEIFEIAENATDTHKKETQAEIYLRLKAEQKNKTK